MAPDDATVLNALFRVDYNGAAAWIDNVYVGLEPEPVVLKMSERGYLVTEQDESVSLDLIVSPVPAGQLIQAQIKEVNTGNPVGEPVVLEPGVISLNVTELAFKSYLITFQLVDGANIIDLESVNLRKKPSIDIYPPNSVSQIDYDTSTAGKVILRWQVPSPSLDDEDLPDKYRLYRSEEQGFLPSGDNFITEIDGIQDIGALLAHTDYLLGNRSYYYRIESVDLAGNVALSEEIEIFVEPTIIPEPVSPREAVTVVNAGPLFKWEPLENVAEYIIYLSPDISFPAEATTIITCPPGGEYQLDEVLSDGTWYWKVMAKYCNATFSDFSQPCCFVSISTSEYSEKIPLLRLNTEILYPKKETLIIDYVLKERGSVFLEIYSEKGKLITRLLTGQIHDSGGYTITWDAKTSKPIGSGVYFIKLVTTNSTKSTTALKKVFIWNK